MTGRNGEAGFTLIEVLIAFTILAASLMVAFGLFSTSLGNIDSARDEREAVLLAQSRLDAVGVEPPLETGDYQGLSERGFAWRVTIAPFDEATPGPDAVLRGYAVQVRVSWTRLGRTRKVELSSLMAGLR